MDGTDEFSNGIKEDGHVRSECEEVEGTDWEDEDNDTNW